jgi:hypothetical protein
MTMGTYIDSGSSTTTTYYTYADKGSSWERYKESSAPKQERVKQKLKEMPIFEVLHDLGAFKSGLTAMLISEEKWERICKLFSSPELAHLSVKMINTTMDGIFFDSIPHQLVMIVYGVFDEDVSIVEKANYIKKAMYYLVPGGVLVLLSDKVSPDNLRDIVIFSAVDTAITELNLSETHGIEIRGLVLNKK